MSENYDVYDDVEASGGGSFLRCGVHEVEVVEVTDAVSKNPKRRGALKYAIQGQVITSTPQEGHHAHYAGEMVGVVIFHGPGSAGYDPTKGTSFGDKDVKAFLVALVCGCGRNPSEVAKWGPIARGVVEQAQTARGVHVKIRVYEEQGKDKVTKAPSVDADGKPIMYKRTVFEPIHGQADKAALLLGGSAGPLPTSKPDFVQTRPSPAAPPAATRPSPGPMRGQAEVIEAAKEWLASGSSAADTAKNLATWGASEFGLSTAQVTALVQTAAN